MRGQLASVRSTSSASSLHTRVRADLQRIEVMRSWARVLAASNWRHMARAKPGSAPKAASKARRGTATVSASQSISTT